MFAAFLCTIVDIIRSRFENGQRKKNIRIPSFVLEKASRARHKIFIRICQRYVNDLCDSVGCRVRYIPIVSERERVCVCR